MSEILDRLAASLFERLPEAVVVPRGVREGQRDDWQPAENDCHTNVATWVHHFPQTKHIRGFLFFDLNGLLPFVWFNAHSVLELEDGRWLDITPSQASRLYPFIPHTGSDEEWAEAERAARLEYYWRRS